MTASADIVAEALRTALPVDVRTLQTAALPERGLYAWWVRDEALPGVPTSAHRETPDCGLLYVGIGPSSPTSDQTFSSRLIGSHIKGNTGSSTFRLTLAAHLIDALALAPTATKKKVVLPAQDNIRLTEWMKDHLNVTWVAHSAPWEVEAAVVALLAPPLNIDHNRQHRYCPTNSALRAQFKQRAT